MPPACDRAEPADGSCVTPAGLLEDARHDKHQKDDDPDEVKLLFVHFSLLLSVPTQLARTVPSYSLTGHPLAMRDQPGLVLNEGGPASRTPPIVHSRYTRSRVRVQVKIKRDAVGRTPGRDRPTARRMCQGKKGVDKAALLRSLIQTLEEYGWARLVPLETGQAGRPPEEIHLNPEALRGEELPDDDEEIEKNPSRALSRQINSIFSSYLGGSRRENGHPEPDDASSNEDPGTESRDIPTGEQDRLWTLANAANAAGPEDLWAAWVEAVRRHEVTLASVPIWAGRFQEAISEARVLA